MTDESLSALLVKEVGEDLLSLEFNDETDIIKTLKHFGNTSAFLNALISSSSANISFLLQAAQKLEEKRRVFNDGRTQNSDGHCGNTFGLSSLSLGSGGFTPPTQVSFSNSTNDNVSVLSSGTTHTFEGKGSSLETEVRLDTVEEEEESADVETEAGCDGSNKVATEESKSNREDTGCAQSQSGLVDVEDASASQM